MSRRANPLIKLLLDSINEERRVFNSFDKKLFALVNNQKYIVIVKYIPNAMKFDTQGRSSSLIMKIIFEIADLDPN